MRGVHEEEEVDLDRDAPFCNILNVFLGYTCMVLLWYLDVHGSSACELLK